MSTTLRIMTQHGPASPSLPAWLRGDFPSGGWSCRSTLENMGWIFIFGCLLNLVIIVSSRSKKSERKQLSSGKALRQAGWGSPLGLLLPSWTSEANSEE